MSPASSVGLPEALERAASTLTGDADRIRPANGDPFRLRELLDSEAAARVLQWLFENEPAAGGELAIEWADDPDLDPAPLLAVDPSGFPKPAKKALRRAHHRLRSRGVEVAEPIAGVVVATIAPVDESISIAAITAVDARGSQMAYLVETNPAGGTRIFEVLLDSERGIGGFEIYNAAQGKVKRFLHKLTGRGDRPAVDVPTDALRALIARVASRQPVNRSAPRGFSEWRSRLTHGADGAATPGALARETLGPVDAADVERAVERAVELVRARELGPWPPENPALQAAAEKLVEIEKSELDLSDSVRREQIDGILAGAVMELYAEPFASCCAERFEEMAYIFSQWGRPDDAGACLAAADAFRSQGPAEHPVARALLEVLLSPAIRRLEGSAAEGEK